MYFPGDGKNSVEDVQEEPQSQNIACPRGWANAGNCILFYSIFRIIISTNQTHCYFESSAGGTCI